MDTQLTISKPFFSRYAQLTYTATLPLFKHHLPYIVDCCLREILPRKALKSRCTIDTKGRDIHDSKGNKTGEEIAFLDGTLTNDNGQKEAFNAQITSDFKSFEGSSHIDHSIKSRRSLSLSDTIPDFLLGYTLSLHTATFRFGLEFFESRFTSSQFGFAPVVTESIFVTADEDRVMLEILFETPRKLNALVIKRDNELTALSAATKVATGTDIKADLFNQIELKKSS